MRSTQNYNAYYTKLQANYVLYYKRTQLYYDTLHYATFPFFDSYRITPFVENCPVCSIHRQQAAEPLITSTLPQYPWQRIATDLFEWKGHTYLLVVDYYSRYIEITKLPQKDASSMEVIRHLKSIMHVVEYQLK